MTEPIESRLQALAKEFQYPPTPPVADAVMSRIRVPVKRPRFGRQLAWALITDSSPICRFDVRSARPRGCVGIHSNWNCPHFPRACRVTNAND